MNTLDGIKNLAGQLFAEKPAISQEPHFDTQTNAHRYVESRIFGASRGLHPDSHTVPQRLAEEPLADKVMHVARLGPYERQLLASLLRAPHSLVLITGSTGSGKTSSLRRVMQFYDENARVGLGWNPTHAYVDFNKLAPEYENLRERDSAAAMALLYEKIPIRIRAALLKSVRKIAEQERSTPTQIVLRLARDACRWAAQEADVPNGREFDWPELLTIGTPHLTGNPELDIENLSQRLTERARDLRQSNLPLAFWCAVFDALAIQSLPTEKSTLLFLDNIDPFPDDVQLTLRNDFIALCLGRTFKLVLALRHSTFRTLRRDRPLETRLKHAIEYTWYPHCGPNPVECVCARLLGFISHPKGYPAFSDLSEIWQQKAIHRALELLLRLTPGGPYYRSLGQLALAGAGDSVRRALQTVRFLFRTTDISFDYSVRGIDATIQLALELQALSCSSAIGLALREELVGITMEWTDDFIPTDAADACAKRLSQTTQAVIRSAFDKPDGWLNPRVDILWSHAEVQSMFIEDIETAAALLQERMVSHGIPKSEARQFRASVARLLAERLQRLDPQQRPGFAALIAAISTAMRSEHPDAAAAREECGEFLFSWDRLRICTEVLATNRPHILSRSLIGEGILQNLFVDSNAQLTLLPLTLLYYLALSGGELHLSKVLPLARTLAGEDEVLDLFNRLCGAEGRVIWANHEFCHESYEELENLAKDRTRVKLTHGGWAYYLGVLDEIDYVLETFSGPVPGTRDRLLSRRLEVAVRELERFLELSLATTEHSSLWLRIQGGVAADIIIRCTAGFIRAVRGHFLKMQDPQTARTRQERIAESQRTRIAAIAWTRLLQKAKERACSCTSTLTRLSPANNAHLLPLARIGHYRGFGPMVGTCEQRWQNAMTQMESLLRGRELWAPNLYQDQYSRVEPCDAPPAA